VLSSTVTFLAESIHKRVAGDVICQPRDPPSNKEEEFHEMNCEQSAPEGRTTEGVDHAHRWHPAKAERRGVNLVSIWDGRKSGAPEHERTRTWTLTVRSALLTLTARLCGYHQIRTCSDLSPSRRGRQPSHQMAPFLAPLAVGTRVLATIGPSRSGPCSPAG
jgi:hypothetical protein